MIEVISVRKADNDEPPHFELVYVDLDKEKNEKGYFQTTKYGPASVLREVLKSGGVSDANIDTCFGNA